MFSSHDVTINLIVVLRGYVHRAAYAEPREIPNAGISVTHLRRSLERHVNTGREAILDEDIRFGD